MDVFGALADPVRRSLLRRLAAGPRRVVDLAAPYDVSRPAVSKHLRLLTEAGLVDVVDRGRERHYTLRPAGLDEVRAFLAGLAAPDLGALLSGNALDALDTEVRRAGRDRRAATTRRQPEQETA
ncbi:MULTISPECIES: ArsR/SmtB family transcription factor [Pseudofrankia]|uniref:ArsR/SmtB family transcription factor n=1 Tax=Pseudofrankia TaxID=2994363 RepID=UPI000234D313|nr:MULTISPECIES: metalloregulator ArsR/SmtB family transcription factor [Pseudofrankia]OHV33881.1 transcriptional regulator [Pseudofrankia sp. EUN1h]